MDVQNFMMQTLKLSSLKPETGQGKGGIRSGNSQFQSFLETMGMFAAMQNPQGQLNPLQASQEGEETALQDVFAADLMDVTEMLGSGGIGNPGDGQMEKYLFWSRRQQPEELSWAIPGEDGLQDEQQQKPFVMQAVQQPETDAGRITSAGAAGMLPETGGRVQELAAGVETRMTLQEPVKETALDDAPQTRQAAQHLAASTAAQEGGQNADGISTDSFQEMQPKVGQDEWMQTADRLDVEEPAAEKKTAFQEGMQPGAETENPAQMRTFQETSKTGQAEFHVPVTEKDVSETLGRTLSQAVRTGHNEFEIQLEPANLGRISIKVSTEDHQTVILLSCSQEKTLQLLAQNAKEIGAIMESNLGTPPQILVERQAADYLEQESNQAKQQNQERQQEQQQRHRGSREQEDFLQKLRVGLIGVPGLE